MLSRLFLSVGSAVIKSSICKVILLTLLMITAESILSKRAVSKIAIFLVHCNATFLMWQKIMCSFAVSHHIRLTDSRIFMCKLQIEV